MLESNMLNDKKTMNSTEPESETVWVFGILHMVVLLLIVFVAEISTVQADGLFDFQMKLAKKGNAEAQLKVGGMYESGFGVKKDMKQAKLWVEKAAAQGNEAAGFKLLYWDMKKNGMKGGNKSKYQSMAKKAEAGDGHAMYYVAMVYANGAGVKVNYDKALDWLNKATLIGILEAEREVEVVREQKAAASAKARKDQAQKKAKAEADKRKQAQAQQKAAEQKKRDAEQKKAAAAAASKAEEAAAKKAEDARKLAEKKAKAAQNEKRRQAMLKKKAAEKQAAKKNNKDKGKQEFESDPCSGKSARFLSTCR